MNTNTEHGLEVEASNSGLIEIPVAELLNAVWCNRMVLIFITAVGALFAVMLAFLIPNEYKSSGQLMPPDAGALSTPSVLGMLSGAAPGMPTLQGGLMNQKTQGGTIKGILSSRTAQDDIIDHFDLRRIYHCRYYAEARDILKSRTEIMEDKPSGIISITVMDRDKYRAHDLVNAYLDELDNLITSMSTSSARRERIFLEERLKSLKKELDSSSHELSQFSSRNATLDYQKQGEAMVGAAAKLQGELMAAQSELYGLKTIYTDNNPRLRAARARIDEMQSQLMKMGGMGDKIDGADLGTNQLFPSIRKLPMLGATYYTLYRRVGMQEAMYEALSRQYEFAKVQESKEIPVIKVLDRPEVPEYKTYPHRAMVVFFGTFLSAFAGVAWIVVIYLFEGARNRRLTAASRMASFDLASAL